MQDRQITLLLFFLFIHDKSINQEALPVFHIDFLKD